MLLDFDDFDESIRHTSPSGASSSSQGREPEMLLDLDEFDARSAPPAPTGTSSTVNASFSSHGRDQTLQESVFSIRSEQPHHPHFVLQFISVQNLPGRCNPYCRAYFGVDVSVGNAKMYGRVGNYVTTRRRMDCSGSAAWSSYRDLRWPTTECLLVLELRTSSPRDEDDEVLALVAIPWASLQDEEVHTLEMTLQPAGAKLANYAPIPAPLINIRQAFARSSPPRQRTFFLIRHGESKWNRAQSSGNVGAMLDRDHALTEIGIQQATDLNERWRHYASTGECLLPDFAHSAPAHPAAAGARGGFWREPTEDVRAPVKESEARSTQHKLLAAKVTSMFSKVADIARSRVEHAAGLSTGTSKVELSSASAAAAMSDSAQEGPLAMRVSSEHGSDSFSSGSSGTGDHHKEYVFEEEEERARVSAVDGSTDADTSTGRVSPTGEAAAHNWRMRMRHSLSRDVVQHRRIEYMDQFLQGDAVFSSPLTRAIETAFVVLEGHPALASNGLSLYSIIREVKGIGGLDSVGIEVGDAIETRVRLELGSVVGLPRAQELMVDSIFVNDADQQWWTPIHSFEPGHEQQVRVKEFLTFVRYCPAELPIFVGHSLFFKAFYSKRISKLLDKNRPYLAEHMRQFRLGNTTVMAVTVMYSDAHEASEGGGQQYDDDGGLEDAEIMDAEILFGGCFHGHINPTLPPPGNKAHAGHDGDSRGWDHDSENSHLGKALHAVSSATKDFVSRVHREKEKLMQRLDK